MKRLKAKENEGEPESYVLCFAAYNNRIDPSAGGCHAGCLRNRRAGSPPGAALPRSPSGPSSQLIRTLRTMIYCEVKTREKISLWLSPKLLLH